MTIGKLKNSAYLDIFRRNRMFGRKYKSIFKLFSIL